MKQLRLPIFNSNIKYYNLRIVPPEDAFDRIIEFKKLFEFAYGKQPLSGSKPHITLASFKMNSKHQDVLIQILERLSQRDRFDLNINGFDVFETSKTLYLNVTKTGAIKELHDEIQRLYNNGFKKRLKSFLISETPHITIAKANGRRMLHDSLRYFQENQYHNQIEIDHLTLVSRLKYRTWDWEHQIPLS
ncbi:MAG: 2'-5' RNA ligase family protein [Bacteroidota bacterium]